MEIEQDVSRTVDSVDDVNTRHRYQPRSALGSVWEDTVSTDNAEVVHRWLVAGRSAAWLTALGEGSQAAQGAGSSDLR